MAKPSPPSRWSDAPAGMPYGVPPRRARRRGPRSQLSLKPMPKPARVEAHLGAHDARQHDVADPVVDRVRPVDPALLDEHGLEAELRGHRGDLAGVVGLVAADRHEGVGALREHVGDDVLELAGLVAAVRQPAVAVLALGPDPRAAQVRGEPVQRVDRARPEQQRVAGEVGQGHGCSSGGRVSATLLTSTRPCRSTGGLPGQESNLRRTRIQSAVAPASRATRDGHPQGRPRGGVEGDADGRGT